MHEQHFLGIAYGGAAGLGVLDYGQGHIGIGAFVHEYVADAHPRLDAGHFRVLGAGADQPAAPAGYQQVYIAHRAHEVSGALAGGVLHELYEIRLKTCRGEPFAQRRSDCI